MSNSTKISIKEKIGYALGDGAANIAWRGVTTFLFVFYTDVFGLSPATAGLVLLFARSSDGVGDVIMGVIGDRTNSKYGKFRPWILWTAIPLGMSLSLLFISPELSEDGKILYAYISYLLFTLIYTANNIPYGSLMAVMTADDKERTSIGSYRMAGAFGGGMLVQGALLFLVAYFGNVNPSVDIIKLNQDSFKVKVVASMAVEHAKIKTKDGVATFVWQDSYHKRENEPSNGKSFEMKKGASYNFIVSGESELSPENIIIVDQQKGYSKSMYIMSALLSLLMIITFLSTKERVHPIEGQENNLWKDAKDLFTNKPWFVLLVVGFLFNVYNSIKQGIVIIYFTHYLNNQLLSASYLMVLMLASIVGAFMTAPLSKKVGKRNLFIYALLFSGAVNALFVFCGPNNTGAIFTLGAISELASAMFPTLFFVMLGDSADYSEYKNGRRATGLIYSAGSFATKFGCGISAAIIGFVLTMYHYDGQNLASIPDAIPGIIMLMSWIPALVTVVTAGLMLLYPLNQNKMDIITQELKGRRGNI